MFQAILGATGWQPDVPDPRDMMPDAPGIKELLHELAPLGERPPYVDWRHFCGDVQETDHIPSSVHACVDLLTHAERRSNGERIGLSKLFVYRVSQRMARSYGLPAHSLRTIWKTITQFGAPPAYVWPATDGDRDIEPDAFTYFSARDYSALRYIRLDGRDQSGHDILKNVRWFLAGGFSVVFGFPLCTAITDDGQIGFPTVYDVIRGGHAILSVGYDDDRRVRSERGCLLVRSCWGRAWGENGYGWLPYRYVRERLTTDFWTVIHPQWIKSDEFKRPRFS